MRRSKIHFYFHVVWATHGREPLVMQEHERRLYRCIIGQVERLGCTVLAIGGMPDHVHLVIRTPARFDAPALLKQVKGTSSALANDLSPQRFRWQEGYAAFSVTPSHLPAMITYVAGQKEHHAAGTLQPEWEETDEAVPEDEPQ